MDTTRTRIALGTILLLQLLFLCLSYFSMADFIYRPVDHFSINCGSSVNFSLDSRNWTGDSSTKFLSEGQGSVAATAQQQTTIQGPYTYSRLSYSQFTYSFPVNSSGPKFLRLFFYSTSYDNNFVRSKAYFSVKAGPYTLLKDFNASLNADAEDDPGQPNIIIREYCINVLEDEQRLNITFIPNTTAQNPDSYAFINGIEMVSMPPYLYYTNSNTEWPRLVGTTIDYEIKNSSALETKYRLRVGQADIPASRDTGMFRIWEADDKYVDGSVLSADFGKSTNLSFTKTPNYTAPDEVYRSLRNMGPDPSANMRSNITWLLPVDSGFTYLLRLHFCQLNPRVNEKGVQIFYIYIQDQLVEDLADIFAWGDEQKGVPVVRKYVVIVPQNQEGKQYLSLKLHPHPKSLIKDTILNAIELLKLNDTTGNLAGPDPSPRLQISNFPPESLNKKSSSTKRTIAAVAGAVSGVVLVSFIIAFFLIKHKKNVAVHKGSQQKDEAPRGGGASSLPTNLCRHFTIAEIRAATNNFDELFVVGVGGFGDVYKGYIDDSSTRVAVKRLKPGSQQGVQEFLNEIEMLSQLRHLHLVSLIGYCYESNEMILVYEFMDRGTLRDHLYDTDNPSLSWRQRLEICIGAAQGLHYLHTGAKHMIIHRDIKSTNILLDEKWVAKVSDFGLSRLGPTGSSITHVSTQVKGSIGYLDPEYYKRQRLTEKSDVYSFGVVLLEVLCGRQPLLRTVEKQQMSLVHWAKNRYEKGSLGEIVDPVLKGQIAPECLRKFGEIAMSCLLDDGSERPSMNDVVGVLEFVLRLQDSAITGVVEGGGNYEDSDDMFSTSHRSGHVSDYSKSTGFSTTTDGYRSFVSKESDRLIPENVFSEIRDPKGRR